MRRASPRSGDGASGDDLEPLEAPRIQSCLRSQRFPRSIRLRKRGQFLATQRRGKRIHHDALIIYISANRGGPVRLGITASRKVGSAVVRNRVKRLLREAFRTHPLRDQRGFDLVLVARKEAPPPTLAVYQAALDLIAAQPPPRVLGKNSRGRRMKRRQGTPRASTGSASR